MQFCGGVLLEKTANSGNKMAGSRPTDQEPGSRDQARSPLPTAWSLSFQRIRLQVQDVVRAPALPDFAGVAARVVAGDQSQLGQLLVQRPAADAVEPTSRRANSGNR
jgi:hypothetical protein